MEKVRPRCDGVANPMMDMGKIFAKFTRMVELCLDMNDLNLVLRSIKGRYHGNQFFRFLHRTEL